MNEEMNKNLTFFSSFNRSFNKSEKSTIRKHKIKPEMSEEKQKKVNKTPAVVQDIVQVVKLKKRYYTLRNLKSNKKGVFEFNIDVRNTVIVECATIHQEKICSCVKKCAL